MHSSLFKRWVELETVPALREQVNPPCSEEFAAAALQSVPLDRGRKRWFQFHPLGPRPSLVALACLMVCALTIGAVRFILPPVEETMDHRLGATLGTMIVGFLAPLFAGWFLSMLAWWASLRRRALAIGTFFTTAAAVVAFSFMSTLGMVENRFAPLPDRLVSEGLRGLIHENPPIPAAAPNPALEFARLASDSAKDAAAVRSRYDAALAQLDLRQLRSPARLTDPSTFADARARCLAAARLVDTFETDFLKTMSDMPDRASRLNLPEITRQQLIVGLIAARSKNEPAFKQMIELERQLVREIFGLVKMVENNPSGVAIEAGRLVFSNPADADAYNGGIKRIGSTVMQQAALQKAGPMRLEYAFDSKSQPID